jgi:hypothetical protein
VQDMAGGLWRHCGPGLGVMCLSAPFLSSQGVPKRSVCW